MEAATQRAGQDGRSQGSGPVPSDEGAVEAEHGDLIPAIRRAVDSRALVDLLVEMRARDATDPAGPSAVAARLEEAIAERLAELRRATTRANYEGRLGSNRVRWRLLDHLSYGSAGSTDLAKLLSVRPETVSRELRKLEQEELVSTTRDPDDGRRRIHSLTARGQAEYEALRAFVAPGGADPPREARDDVVLFLKQALRAAVGARRKVNKLDDAAMRIAAVAEEASDSDVPDVALRARRELATTLRQAGDYEAFRRQLYAFQQILAGRLPGFEQEYVLPAFAHYQYEVGRLPLAAGGGSLADRARSLNAAAKAFHELHGSKSRIDDWRDREAWALVSLANNFREQTWLGLAVQHAAASAAIFEELDDAYGLCRCWFLIGFSERLRGSFGLAWQALSHAHNIAAEHGFERFRVDSLVQQGEVLRCRGDLDKAQDSLSEAHERAEVLGLGLVSAFAECGLGAAAFNADEPDRALTHLKRARRNFEQLGHSDGLALALRRQAVARRRTAGRATIDPPGLIERAQKRYVELNSPAGVAACLVEQGRRTVLSGDDPSWVRRQLCAALEDGGQRKMLELDPWVPRMVNEFADEVGDTALAQQATGLLDRFHERRAAANARLATLHFAGLRLTPDTEVLGGGVDEMAGEHRHIAVPVELQAA